MSDPAARLLASIPSPPWSEWSVGPLTIRAYAVCIILGVVAAVVIGNRRWIARGGQPGVVVDLVLWAVPFGMVGARLYHVITDYQLYFGQGRDPVRALFIWEGGLGIWGAIAGGGLGVWIACRRRGIPMPAMADALAPGIVVAQAIGRFGNWFNKELFGAPTTLPWGLEIPPERRPEGYEVFETFHPTFLYEALWCVGVALVVVWADRRFRMGHGRVFALYVAAYTLGRVWIEYLRIDDVNHVLGLRLNVWTSLIVFAGAVTYLLISRTARPGREDPASLSSGVDGPATTAAGASTNVRASGGPTDPTEETTRESPGEDAAEEPKSEEPKSEDEGAGEPAPEASRAVDDPVGEARARATGD